VASPRVIICCLFVASFLCATAEAQSGRRVRAGEKPGATPAPAPVIDLPKPESPAAAPKRTLPNVALIVAGRVDKSSDRSETIFNTFVVRLGQSLKTTSLGLVKHDEAEKRARAETENYVVWLELERDTYQQGKVIFNSLDYVVRYSILAPGTAQVKAHGKLYYQAMGGARTRTGEGDLVKITPEDAGNTAADMVLDWLVVVAAHKDMK
jgi:hypothetical protein